MSARRHRPGPCSGWIRTDSFWNRDVSSREAAAIRKMRVGVIGLGHVAQVCHLPGMAKAKHVDVVACAEVRKETLDDVSARWGMTPYLSYEDMLRSEELDIACVLTGPRHSGKIVGDVAEAGVNVLVEKPMALDVKGARQMTDQCRQKGVKLFYGESFRFFPAIRKAEEIVRSGILGDLRLVLETVVQGLGANRFEEYGIYPKGAPGSGPMGLMDHGVHLVDVFRRLSAEDVSWVFGRGNRAGSPPSVEFMTLGTESGAVAQFVGDEATFPSDLPGEGIFSAGPYEGGGPAWDSHPISYRIHCAEGALRAFPYANKLWTFSAEGEQQIEIDDIPHPGQFGLQIDSFARSIFEDLEPEVTAEDGVKALKVLLGAYESYESMQVTRL